jgi:alpha-glucosidase
MKAIPALVAVAPLAILSAAGPIRVTSPDRRVEFRLSSHDGRLHFSVSMHNKPVVEDSPLVILIDGVDLSSGAKTVATRTYRINQKYPWNGAHSTAVDHCNGAAIALSHSSGTRYTLEVRAYNDGVAFRHVIPGASPDRPRVPDESTSFRLPAGTTVWYHDFEGHYEAVHERKLVADTKAGEWAAPPLTFKLPNGTGYGSITEGALYRYPGMGLQADGRGGFQARLGHSHPPSYPFRLRYKADIERMAKPVAITGGITTPWRIVMATPDLNALVSSDIVQNVAPAPDPKLFPKGPKTEWIRPGRAVWKYLDGGGENTIETVKEFSRLAAQLGFEYQVVEGFWTRWPPEDLKAVIDYSKGLGVDLILWKHSNALRSPESQTAFFELISKAGAAGAKIDFFDHEAKEVVDLYEQMLRGAAAYKLVLNFHGANKPTGESRTYPNELTREGIRGMESRRNPRAQHHATLPFTRMLAGHADYTPVVFGERRNDTSWANQIASAATFTSPLLIYGAHPKSLLDSPAVEIIKSIPSVWDETVVLPPSEIGELSALARRRGDTWFVAVMNGTRPGKVSLPLSFLGGGNYASLQARDQQGKSDAIEVSNTVLTRASTIELDLEGGGGFIARIKPSAR